MTENQTPTCSLTCWHVSLDGIHQRLAHKVIPFVDGHKISCFCSIHLLVVHCKPNEPFLGLMNNSHRQLGYSDVNSTAKRIFSFFKKKQKRVGQAIISVAILINSTTIKICFENFISFITRQWWEEAHYLYVLTELEQTLLT